MDEIAFNYSIVLTETPESANALRDEINRLVVPLIKKMALPKSIELCPEVPLLGNFLNRKVSRIYGKLEAKHKEKLPDLAASSNKYYRTAICSGALWIRLSIERKHIHDSAYTRMLSTEDGYAESEGRAYTLYNYLSEQLDVEEKLNVEYGSEHAADDMLEAIGIHWLNQVNDEIRDRETINFELLGEALDAMELARSNSMWNDALEYAKEEISAQRRQAARKRHTENYAMKAEVYKYYIENRERFKSGEAAAEAILKANLVPVGFRTIRAWITDFNKPQSAC